MENHVSSVWREGEMIDPCSACGSTEHTFADCPENPISRGALEEWYEFEGRDPRGY
jgi:hypothetical protein